MEPLFLTKYLQSPLFIKEINEHQQFWFDAIFTDFEYEEKPSIDWYTTKNNTPNKTFIELRETEIEKHHKCLIILSKFSISALQTILEKDAEKITVLNMYIGMWSIGHKLKGENNDLDELNEYHIFEPIDLTNLLSILHHTSGKSIIRIPDQMFENSIFDTEEITFIEKNNIHFIKVFSLMEYGFMGDDATIISTGSNFPTILQLWEILQQEKFEADYFILEEFDRNQEKIINSIQKTKNVFIIIDHKDTPQLFTDLKTFCKENAINLTFITPKYEKITTIFEEYYKEQAEFDAERLANRILE